MVAVREKAKKQEPHPSKRCRWPTSVGLPSWVEVDTAKMTGTFKSCPDRADVARDINESLVVELYSR